MDLKSFDFEDEALVGVKIRGLPYRAMEEEVYDFFRDFKVKRGCL